MEENGRIIMNDKRLDKLAEIEDEVIYIKGFLIHMDSELQDHEIAMRELIMEAYNKTSESWDKIIKLLEDK